MIFCSWVIVLSPFPVPEGGSRSQFGVRTAPALGTPSKTNNDCQIKFKLSQLKPKRDRASDRTCLGCCWFLMALLFAAGIMSLV